MHIGFIQFFGCKPACVLGIRSGFHFSTLVSGKKEYQDKVIRNTVFFIPYDIFADIKDTLYLNLYGTFFKYFAFDGLVNRFTQLYPPPRETPFPLAGFSGTFYQKHVPFV